VEEKKEDMKWWFGTVVLVLCVQSDLNFNLVKKLVAPIEPTLKAAVAIVHPKI
jgi:hypothetical protein